MCQVIGVGVRFKVSRVIVECVTEALDDRLVPRELDISNAIRGKVIGLDRGPEYVWTE